MNITEMSTKILFISDDLERCQVELLKNASEKTNKTISEAGYVSQIIDETKIINIISRNRVEEYTRHNGYIMRYKLLTNVYEIVEYDHEYKD
jgi:hypothetical protein